MTHNNIRGGNLSKYIYIYIYIHIHVYTYITIELHAIHVIFCESVVNPLYAEPLDLCSHSRLRWNALQPRRLCLRTGRVAPGYSLKTDMPENFTTILLGQIKAPEKVYTKQVLTWMLPPLLWITEVDKSMKMGIFSKGLEIIPSLFCFFLKRECGGPWVFGYI